MNKKPFKVGLLTLLLVCSLGSGAFAQEEASSSARNQARWNVSMQTAALTLVDSLQRLAECDADTSTLLIEGMTASMLEDVESHATVVMSRDKALEDLATTVDSLVADLVEQSVEFAQLQSSIPVTEELVIGKVGLPYWQELQATTLAELTKSHFPRLFQAARLRAVLAQRHMLETDFKMPPFDALNARLNAALPADAVSTDSVLLGSDAFAPVVDLLADYEEEERAVFEELVLLVQDRTGQKLELIKDQYGDQIEVLEEAATPSKVPGQLIQADAIASHLQEVLAGAVEGRKEAQAQGASAVFAPATIYAPFDVALLYASPLGQEVETAKFSSYIESIDLPLPSQTEIQQWISSDLAAHQSVEASYEIVESRSLAAVAERLASGYVVEKKGANDSAVEGYFIEKLGPAEPLGMATLVSMSGPLEMTFEKARASLVASQLGSVFPEVASKSPLQSGIVEQMFINNAMDQDYDFQEAINYMGRGGSINESSLFEETKVEVTGYFNDQVRKGRAAILGQIRAVLEVEQRLGDSLRARVNRDDPYDMIYADWLQNFENVWESSAEYAVSGSAGTYELSGEMLGWAVRQLYNSPKVTAPLTPPGAIPTVVFGWEKDEVAKIKRERDRWEIRYREAYERQQRELNKK